MVRASTRWAAGPDQTFSSAQSYLSHDAYSLTMYVMMTETPWRWDRYTHFYRLVTCVYFFLVFLFCSRLLTRTRLLTSQLYIFFDFYKTVCQTTTHVRIKLSLLRTHYRMVRTVSTVNTPYGPYSVRFVCVCVSVWAFVRRKSSACLTRVLTAVASKNIFFDATAKYSLYYSVVVCVVPPLFSRFSLPLCTRVWHHRLSRCVHLLNIHAIRQSSITPPTC